MADNRMKQKERPPSAEGNGLQKSLKLIFVYTVATGSIFTYVSYWDSVFFSYCGAGTFLAFALMTVAILPTALVYSEISPLFKTAGGELIYNTVGFNKHVGFLASWLIMAAWLSLEHRQSGGHVLVQFEGFDAWHSGVDHRHGIAHHALFRFRNRAPDGGRG